jgi:hypothetical protein
MGDPIAAMDSEYARAVIQGAAQILVTDTEASCRQAQALTEDRLARGVRDIFIVHGTMWNAYNGIAMISPEFARTFERSAGQGTLAEWALLVRQPMVQKLVALQAPLRNHKMIDDVAEHMRRFLILQRAPKIATDLEELLLKPDLDGIRDRDESVVGKAVSKFLESSQDPQVARYLELSEIHAQALLEAHKTGFTGLFAIHEVYPGISSRLKALCIPIDP